MDNIAMQTCLSEVKKKKKLANISFKKTYFSCYRKNKYV